MRLNCFVYHCLVVVLTDDLADRVLQSEGLRKDETAGLAVIYRINGVAFRSIRDHFAHLHWHPRLLTISELNYVKRFLIMINLDREMK